MKKETLVSTMVDLQIEDPMFVKMIEKDAICIIKVATGIDEEAIVSQLPGYKLLLDRLGVPAEENQMVRMSKVISFTDLFIPLFIMKKRFDVLNYDSLLEHIRIIARCVDKQSDYDQLCKVLQFAMYIKEEA